MTTPILSKLAASAADITERHGAMRAAQAVRALVVNVPADVVICAAVSELRARGRDGLASQLAATRFGAQPSGDPAFQDPSEEEWRAQFGYQRPGN